MFHYSLRVIDEPKMSEIRIFNLCHKKTILVDIYRQSLLINFSCYMLPINILIYTVYPSIISQGLFFCTKSARSFKGQRLFEEENIPSFPSAPWSDGWTQNIKFSFTSLAISLFSKMGLKDQNLCIEAHWTYFIHSLSSDLYSDLVVIHYWNLFTQSTTTAI